nr:glycosyltransferase family 4 protein [Flavobacterium sp.]
MRLAVFTHVMHKFSDADYFAYGPYVREMNLWFRNFDLIEVVAPVTTISHHPIDLPYGKAIILSKTRSFELTSFKASFRAIGSMPFNIYQIVKVMRRADHIHLRCPGNIGLLACVVQIFFPRKRKTAKYAGNWDPESHQPWSYKLQRWILSNTFLTRNMQVLVYGNWEGQSANIKPFFTATYRVSDKAQIPPRTLGGAVKLMFAGTLSSNKQPLYAVQLLQELQEQGVEASLEIFGDGELKKAVTNYIRDNNLTNTVRLNGNRASAEIAEAYRESHFLILPSKSEGWPKVVAEAMF